MVTLGKEWVVDYDGSRPKSCRWRFTHVDYDGPEDHRMGYSGSLWGCIQEICRILEEQAV